MAIPPDLTAFKEDTEDRLREEAEMIEAADALRKEQEESNGTLMELV